MPRLNVVADPQMTKTKTKQSEERQQALVVKWASRPKTREACPALKWLHHSPNGGNRSALVGAQMMALGTKKGFPDLIIPAPNGRSLAIEMKTHGGRLADQQEEWLEYLSACGWTVATCWSAESAHELICHHFDIDSAAHPLIEVRA